MQKERELLLVIKSRFGWPVNLRRYGLSDTKDYWDGEKTTKIPNDLVTQRIRISKEKIARARTLLRKLEHVPWIQGIFITGSVASYNAKVEDDIDIWLLVDERRIWVTRAIDFLLYAAIGKRRLSVDGVESTRVKDKLCFNMYTTPAGTVFADGSVSYAMQFVDAIPVYLREKKVYSDLLESNTWIMKIFPSWYQKMLKKYPNTAFSKGAKRRIPYLFLDALEYILGMVMLLKARKKLYVLPRHIFLSRFTTWGTKRILYVDDNETLSERS